MEICFWSFQTTLYFISHFNLVQQIFYVCINFGKTGFLYTFTWKDIQSVLKLEIYIPLSHLSILPCYTNHFCMSSLSASMNLLWGLPHFLLPGSSKFITFCSVYPLSLLITSPNHLSVTFLTLSPNCLIWAVSLMLSLIILSILITPSRNLQLCHFQLHLLTFC